MTDKQNQIENDAAGCARLHEVAFTLSAKRGIAVAALACRLRRARAGVQASSDDPPACLTDAAKIMHPALNNLLDLLLALKQGVNPPFLAVCASHAFIDAAKVRAPYLAGDIDFRDANLDGSAQLIGGSAASSVQYKLSGR